MAKIEGVEGIVANQWRGENQWLSSSKHRKYQYLNGNIVKAKENRNENVALMANVNGENINMAYQLMKSNEKYGISNISVSAGEIIS